MVITTEHYETIMDKMLSNWREKFTADDVHAIFKNIPQKQVEVLIYKLYNDYTIEEIAKLLNLSIIYTRDLYHKGNAEVNRAIKYNMYTNAIERDTKVEYLNISSKHYCALKRGGLHTVGQAIDATFEDLVRIRGVGKKTAINIMSDLDHYVDKYGLERNLCRSVAKYDEYHIKNSFATQLPEEMLNHVYNVCNVRTEKYGYIRSCKNCNYRGVNGYDCIFNIQPRIWDATKK
jgi:DNA-directed RNA polymerase alpha subunit